MPDGLIPDEGLAGTVMRILDQSRGGSSSWRLVFWVNDLTPDADTVYADLELATWEGYSFVTLDASKWVDPVVTDGCATTTYGTDPLTWLVLNSKSQTNYGFALIDTATNVIRFIQRFEPEDIQPLETGGQVLLLPQYTLTSAACSGATPP